MDELLAGLDSSETLLSHSPPFDGTQGWDTTEPTFTVADLVQASNLQPTEGGSDSQQSGTAGSEVDSAASAASTDAVLARSARRALTFPNITATAVLIGFEDGTRSTVPICSGQKVTPPSHGTPKVDHVIPSSHGTPQGNHVNPPSHATPQMDHVTPPSHRTPQADHVNPPLHGTPQVCGLMRRVRPLGRIRNLDVDAVALTPGGDAVDSNALVAMLRPTRE